MEFYWVNVGKTIKEVLNEQFLWAPEASQTQSGETKHLEHWDNVASVKSGDVIFCCHSQKITHVAVATQDAYRADRPATRSFSEWGTIGNRVDVDLTPLRNPIHRDEIASEFTSLYDPRCMPSIFTSGATLKQIYMARLPKDAGVYLLELAHLIERFEDDLVNQEANKKQLSKTTRDAIVKARVGQGKFRSDLLRRWNCQCSLTGLANPDLLIASHIHAWSLSNNDQRIDTDNGLLLAPHIDRLFDRGLISFGDDGALLVGPSVAPTDRRVLTLDTYRALRGMSVANRRYMSLHRRRHGFEQ